MLYELSLFEGFGSESEKNSTLYPWWGGAEKDFDELTKEAFGTVVSGIEAVSDSNALIHDALPFIQGGGERLALEVYRLWAYFFLNFFAFYGYLMAPVTYYTPVGHNGLSDFLKFRMSDEDADWAGNFAGDLCWTIEPALILFGGWLISWWLRRDRGEEEEEAVVEKKVVEEETVEVAAQEPVTSVKKAATPKKKAATPKKPAAATPKRSKSPSRGRSKSPAASTPVRKSTRKQKKA